MTECIRCGTCCIIKIEGKSFDCKHLVRLSNGKTYCKIYNNRVMKVIYKSKTGREIRCLNRKDVHYNYPGCPMNKEGQKMVSDTPIL